MAAHDNDCAWKRFRRISEPIPASLVVIPERRKRTECQHRLPQARTFDVVRKKEVIKMLKKLCALALCFFTLAACETVEGFGRDVQSGGEVIEGTANDVADDI